MFRYIAVLVLLCIPMMGFAEEPRKKMSIHYGRINEEEFTPRELVKSWRSNMELTLDEGSKIRWSGSYVIVGQEKPISVTAIDLGSNRWLLTVYKDGKEEKVGGHLRRFGDQFEFEKDPNVKNAKIPREK